MERRRLRDRLARTAAELLAHMLGHEPLPRDDIERLGDILADLGELAAATARARGRRRVNNAPPRQVLRCAAAPWRRVKPCTCTRAGSAFATFPAGGRGQLLELQLQLINEPLTALRARAELLALHLDDHQLQMLDQDVRPRESSRRLFRRS